MSEELPIGWAEVQISDVCLPVSQSGPAKAQTEFQYVDLGAIDNQTKKIINVRTVSLSEAPSRAKQVLQPGDVLFSNVRVYLENIALIPSTLTNTVGSTAFSVLRPAPGISPKWVYYFVTSGRFIHDVNKLARGNSPPSVQDGDVRSKKMPLAAKEEQVRIASKIDELFSSIDEGERALERVRKLVERYRQSVLKAAVTGELTREWREQHAGELESGEALLTRILEARRQAWEQSELAKMTAKGVRPSNDAWQRKYKEPNSSITDGLDSLPNTWCWGSVEQLSTKVVDGVHKKPSYVTTGIPFVTVRNLTAGSGISFEKLNFITLEDHCEFTKRTNPEQGDVLVSKDGTLGTIRLVKTDRDFSIFVSVALIKPVLRDMGPYLELALSSPVVQAQMVPKGTGLQHIHLEDLRQDCIPLCSSAEQQLIADTVARRMSQIDEIEAYLFSQIANTSKLRQSVLKAAFAGMLVPQDPTDEPASVLLERIAAERAARASQASAAKGKRAKADSLRE